MTIILSFQNDRNGAVFKILFHRHFLCISGVRKVWKINILLIVRAAAALTLYNSCTPNASFRAVIKDFWVLVSYFCMRFSFPFFFPVDVYPSTLRMSFCGIVFVLLVICYLTKLLNHFSLLRPKSSLALQLQKRVIPSHQRKFRLTNLQTHVYKLLDFLLIAACGCINQLCIL